MVLPGQQDSEDKRETEEREDIKVSLAQRGVMVPREILAKLGNEDNKEAKERRAHKATLELLDLLETRETVEKLEAPENLARMAALGQPVKTAHLVIRAQWVVQVNLDHQDFQDPKEHEVLSVKPVDAEIMAYRDLRVNQVQSDQAVFLAPRDKWGQVDLAEKLERMGKQEHPVLTARQEVQANRVPLANGVSKELQEETENREIGVLTALMESWEKLVIREIQAVREIKAALELLGKGVPLDHKEKSGPWAQLDLLVHLV